MPSAALIGQQVGLQISARNRRRRAWMLGLPSFATGGRDKQWRSQHDAGFRTAGCKRLRNARRKQPLQRGLILRLSRHCFREWIVGGKSPLMRGWCVAQGNHRVWNTIWRQLHVANS